MRVLDSTRQSVVGERIRVADGVWSRFVGLLGTTSLPQGEGLLLYPSQGVHSLGMLYSIDVVFLSEDFRVVELRPRLRPFWMTSLNWKAVCVLELPVGAIRNSRMEVGDQLVLEAAGG